MNAGKYTFKATLFEGENSLDNVQCELIVPTEPNKGAELYFFPTEEVYLTLKKLEKIRFESDNLSSDPDVRHIIYSDEDYYFNQEIEFTSDGRKFVCSAIISDLYEKNEYKGDNSTKHGGIFLLSRRSALIRGPIISKDTYEMKLKYSNPIILEIDINRMLTFKPRFKYINPSDEQDVVELESIAEIDDNSDLLDEQQISTYTENLDVYLLLVSFVERQRLSWNERCYWFEGKTVNHRKAVVYDAIRPTSPFLFAKIIVPFGIEEFCNKTYRVFMSFTNEQRKFLSQALNYCLMRENETAEATFLRLYSAVESTISFFKVTNNIESILDDNKWKSFKKDLKLWIKSHPVFSEAINKRKLIYEKVSELNRMSFASLIQSLIDQEKVDVSDLWPLTDSSEGISLSEIRNILIHGQLLNKKQYDALMIATEHLRWTVERILLTILKWPINDTSISKVALDYFIVSHRDWQKYRHYFSE